MENKHLTEDDIQAFILKEIVDENIKIHISQCKECQVKCDTYRILLSSLISLNPEVFSFDVSAIVMQKIEAVETKITIENNNLLYAIIGLFCIGIFTVLFPCFKVIFLCFLKLSIFENGLIFIAILGVAIYLLNDIFRKYKKSKRLLFE